MPTTKHLSYAGVALLLPTPELEAGWLSAVQDAYSFDDLNGWNFDAPAHDSLPTPPIPTPPDFKLNTLYWPTGASRPAWFHCVVESSRLALIKTALGATNVAAPLVMYDSRTGKTVTAQMRMLPSRPVNVSCGDSDEQFYLVTLTDDRFFWYGRRGVVTTPATWAALYAQIEALLGVTLSVETVPSEYATPSAKWVTSYASTPALLDAVAAQVGQRIVVGLDGLVYAVGWETAKAAFDAYLAAADPVTTGGAVADVPRIAPELVVTTFADVSSGSLAAVPHVVTTTLASLAITEYGGATGVADDYETLYADLPYDGANTTAVNDYAARAAFDYYGWLLESPDVVWPGVEPYVPTGWEDACEWTLTTRGPDDPFSITRVRRGPWRTFAGGDYTTGLSPLAPSVCVEGSGSGSGSCTFSDDGYPPSCAPSDGLDPLAVRETVCVMGELYVTTGRQQIVLDCNNRLRLSWYDLVTTQQGCCACDEGSGSGGADPCDDPSLCCNGSGGTTSDTITVVITGPFGADCAEVELIEVLTYNPVTGAWEGTLELEGVSMVAQIRCVNGGWNFEGVVTTADCTKIVVAGELDTDGESLEANVPLAGRSPCGGEATVSADSPCPGVEPTTTVFNDPGDHDFEVTVGGTYLIQCWGPGGTGSTLAASGSRGAGGGGGEYAEVTIVLAPGTHSAHVGLGGQIVADNSTFDSAFDVFANGGATTVNQNGGAGGTGGIGDVTFDGGDGETVTLTTGNGGGGGASGGTTGAGDPGAASLGGATSGAGGNGGDGGVMPLTGEDGFAPGGGGGGGACDGPMSGTAGGIGANGRVQITGPL